MKKNILKIFLLSIILISINSCSEDFLEVKDPNSVETSQEDYPKNEAELISGINAIYSPLQSQGLYGRFMAYLYDNLGQENVKAGNLGADHNDLLEYTFTASNTDISRYWLNCYNGISRANILLSNLDNINAIESLSNEMKNKYIGEARFLRAQYYFLLVSRFGDIPLYKNFVDGEIDGAIRSPKEDVYQFIIEDLIAAKSLLKLKSVEDEGRATSGAASALLGKVYLYNNEFGLAKDAFYDVIDSGEYNLTANYFDNFKAETEYNSESVFEVLFNPAGGGYSWNEDNDTGNVESSVRPAEYGIKGGFHNVNPSNDLINEFESGDSRKEDSFYFDGSLFGTNGDLVINQTDIGDSSMGAWKKYMMLYKQDVNFYYYNFSDINFRVIRYADVLLMAAEAEMRTGSLTNAIALMNQVRARVNMPPYGTPAMNTTFPVTSENEVFTALVHERRVELAAEMTRFPDLVRWGLAPSVIPNFVVGKHELLPIPQVEIDSNSSISDADQNSGY